MDANQWISLAQALSAAIGGLAVVVAAILAFRLGRGAARDDRLREHHLQSISDTRDQWLDLAAMAGASSDGNRRAMLRLTEKMQTERYSRAREVLIVHEALVASLTEALPALLEQFPRVRQDTKDKLGLLKNLIREAMFDQEQHVLRTGEPIPQTPETRARLDAAVERMEATLRRRFRGWRLWVLKLRVVFHA